MYLMRFWTFLFCFCFMMAPILSFAAMTDYPKVRLRSLDKITARTMTFDARVGTTIKFGSMYIKILSCQKPDVADRNDAVAFLQIWEITPDDLSKWIFSGWMFASSPALSAMDHAIYDVWVIDCFADTPPAIQKKNATNTLPSGPRIEDVLKDASATNGGGDSLPSTPITKILPMQGSDLVKEAPPPQLRTPDPQLPPMVDQDFERQGH